MKHAPLLSARAVASINEDGFHAVGGVIGLYLRVRGGSKQYVLRFTSPTTGKRNSISLGNDKALSLSQARTKASDLRAKLLEGIDPVEAKKKQKLARLAAASKATSHTFKQVARDWFDLRTSRPGKRSSDKPLWSMLESRIFPVIGDIPIGDLSVQDVFRCVSPLWLKYTGTRLICLQAISQIWRFASATGLTHTQNPATISGPLGVLLKALGKPKSMKNHGALPPERVPEFFENLLSEKKTVGLALAFAILTASRAYPVRAAKWEDIDLQKKEWLVPEEDMKVKGRGRFKVYLSDQAISLLESLPDRTGIVFKGKNGMIGYGSMVARIKRMNNQRIANKLPQWLDEKQSEKLGKDVVVTPHGVARASFKTWTRTKENLKKFHQDAVELCLAHDIDDKYDGAYDRADLEEERRLVMAAWGEFCFSRIQKV